MEGFWEPYNPPESESRAFTGKQRRYVEHVHSVLKALAQWNAVPRESIRHPLYDDPGCPHCVAESRLRNEVGLLERVFNDLGGEEPPEK